MFEFVTKLFYSISDFSLKKILRFSADSFSAWEVFVFFSWFTYTQTDLYPRCCSLNAPKGAQLSTTWTISHIEILLIGSRINNSTRNHFHYENIWWRKCSTHNIYFYSTSKTALLLIIPPTAFHHAIDVLYM